VRVSPFAPAQRDVAFFGQDATRAVTKVRQVNTQAVADDDWPAHRRTSQTRSGSAGVIAIRRDPAAGLAVWRILSQKNTPTVTMPDLVGKTETAALQKLLSDGIHLKNVDHMHSKVPSDSSSQLIQVRHHAEERTKGKSDVELGVQAAPITIPSVVNLSLAAATSELEASPYLLNVKTDSSRRRRPGRIRVRTP